jgi:hypothetical protein
VLIAIGAVVLGSVVAVQAHEVRQIEAYTLVVGFRVEPAFEDVVNAVDIFINRTSDGRAVSVRDGDIVELDVEVQLRATDAFDAEVLAAAPLQENPQQDFAASNRYNAWFKPTHDGAYAFRITGVISDASDPQAGELAIDATFVCGGGTQSDTTRFNCVEDPQTFPGNPRDGYRNNHPHNPEGERPSAQGACAAEASPSSLTRGGHTEPACLDHRADGFGMARPLIAQRSGHRP